MTTYRTRGLPDGREPGSQFEFTVDDRISPGIVHIPGNHRGPDVCIPDSALQEAWLNSRDDLVVAVWDCQWRFVSEEAAARFVAVLAPFLIVEPRASHLDATDLMIALIDAVGERKIGSEEASRALSDPSTVAIGGYLGDRPAGYLIGYMVTRIDGNPMLIVYDVAVAESHRRRGVATRMIEMALSLARDRGASKAWVVTDTGNEPARSLYGATGAEPSGHDDLIMWWSLG